MSQLLHRMLSQSLELWVHRWFYLYHSHLVTRRLCHLHRLHILHLLLNRNKDLFFFVYSFYWIFLYLINLSSYNWLPLYIFVCTYCTIHFNCNTIVTIIFLFFCMLLISLRSDGKCKFNLCLFLTFISFYTLSAFGFFT